MYILVDQRESVMVSYRAGFEREGLTSVGFVPTEFRDWIQIATNTDLLAVDAFLLGDCEDKSSLPAMIRKCSQAPVIALRDSKSLSHTLELFEAGVDDVVHLPVHVRELLVRTAAIRRRPSKAKSANAGHAESGTLRVFFDGRDPQIDGETIALPRRELRILEYMVTHQRRWITKTQIFDAIYGIFESSLDESVIESHISKLRKKLNARLGCDPILSKRFVGYYFDGTTSRTTSDDAGSSKGMDLALCQPAAKRRALAPLSRNRPLMTAAE